MARGENSEGSILRAFRVPLTDSRDVNAIALKRGVDPDQIFIEAIREYIGGERFSAES